MERVLLDESRRKVEVHRDDHGVPHIRARDFVDGLYALGYMHALDRRTQMFFGRTVAEARAAELLTPSAEMIQRDRFFRRAKLLQTATDETARLGPDHFGELTAYAQGVNDGYRQSGGSFPMWMLGFRPDPWTVSSVLLMGSLLALGGLALGQQRAERLLLEMIAAGVSPDLLRDVYAPHLDGVDFEILKQVRISSTLSDESLERCGVLPRLAGSNAFAVAPSRSASGRALLASDPHLETSRLPATWYEAVLEWPGEYLIGATLPGTPMFAVGRSRRVAWGVTYTMGDVSDFFLEDCRVEGKKVLHRRGDAWLPFETDESPILRRGKKPLPCRVHSNELGVLQADPREEGDGIYLSLAWTGRYGGIARSVETWLKLPFAEDVPAAQAVVRDCPQPPLAWIFADRGGNIGRQVNGAFPKRPPHASGLAPLPAWDEANHWQGLLPTSELPSALNPTEGVLVGANEDLSSNSGIALATLPAARYRFRRLTELTSQAAPISREDLGRFQYDVLSLQASGWLEKLGESLPADLRKRLAGWDRRYTADSEQATLYHAFYEQMAMVLFGQPVEKGGIGEKRLKHLFTQPIFTMLFLGRLDDLLWGPQRRWKPPMPLAEAARIAGERVATFEPPPWGKVNSADLRNAFLDGLPGRLLGLHVLDVPIAGSHATPHQGHVVRTPAGSQAYIPSYHFTTDLGEDVAWTNLPGGPVEHGWSTLYANDLRNWLEGRVKPLSAEPGPE